MKKLLYSLLIVGLLLTAMVALSQDTGTPPAPTTPPTTDTAPTTPAAPTTPTEPAAPKTPATPPANGETPIQGPFANTTPGNTTIAPTGPVDPDKLQVSIAFVRADLPNVLGFLSMASGIPIIIDGDLNGTVTISSVKTVSLTEAYDVINSALRVRSYTMVGTLKDKLIRVVPLKKAFVERPALHTGTDPTVVGESDTVITQVIPLHYISALKLMGELKPLVPDDQANLIAVSSTNTLILTDTEANVKRLLQIIALLDKDNSDVVNLEVYQCKFASAAILINSLSQACLLYTSPSPRD